MEEKKRRTKKKLDSIENIDPLFTVHNAGRGSFFDRSFETSTLSRQYQCTF